MIRSRLQRGTILSWSVQCRKWWTICASIQCRRIASRPIRTITSRMDWVCSSGMPIAYCSFVHTDTVKICYAAFAGGRMVIEDYEILVLGSGEAGKYLGWTMAKAGRKTAVIERKMIGGSCPNIACLPSKNIIHSAKVASDFQRGEEFGMMTESWHVDMEGVRQRKRKMVDGLVQMHLGRFKDSGAELILGNGVFIGPKTMEVTLRDGGTRTLRGKKVFLNTGTRAAMPAIPGLAESKPMTHIEALELAVVPEHLVILGAGYVGLELAQAIRRFGSRVTLLE